MACACRGRPMAPLCTRNSRRFMSRQFILEPVLWFWLFVGPACLLALLSLRGERKRAAYVAECLADARKADWPPATLIVPVKGADEGLRENLAALADLDYPDYELLIAVRRARDIPPGVLPARAKIILAPDDDPETGEKVQNLWAAVRCARKVSEVFAFADSDGRVSRDWLKALVRPLAGETVGASTGYRWYTPEPPDFWSLLRSVWNAPIAGAFGPGDNRFAWGGAMAIRKETFYSARRQLVITRVCYPRLWWPALAAHVIYCGGMAAAAIAAALGHRGAEWALIVQLSPGMLKGANRATLAKAALPAWQAWFDRYGWVHTWWVPLATWVWLAALISSAAGNVIHWRGRRYHLRKL